jgi:hypothetical protein
MAVMLSESPLARRLFRYEISSGATLPFARIATRLCTDGGPRA